MGIKSVLVSGDREEAVTSVGEMVGIGTINAALTPQQKSSIISSLQAEGHSVAMVIHCSILIHHQYSILEQH